jgi:hypothetical protein
VARNLSAIAIVLGILSWIIGLFGSTYAYLSLSDVCSPMVPLFTPRMDYLLSTWQLAWYFAFIGLPIAIIGFVAGSRGRYNQIALSINLLLWAAVLFLPHNTSTPCE